MREWIFQNLEHIFNAVKFLGILRGLEISAHFIRVNLFFRKRRKGEYKFSHLRFKYADSESLLELFSGIFTSNPYYFTSNVRDPIILDIGANIGDTLLYFKYLYPESTVVCFEPHPDAYNLLTENVKVNHFENVITFQEALGGKMGSITLYNSDFGNYRTASSSKDWTSTAILNVNSKKIAVKSHKVRLNKLSNKLQSLALPRIDLLKIDAEGAELAILNDLQNKSMLGTITRIILEYHPLTDRSDNSFDKIYSILQQNQFSMSIFNYYRSIYNRPNDKAFMLVAEKKDSL